MEVPEKILKLEKYLVKFDIDKRIDRELKKLEKKITTLNKRQLARGKNSQGEVTGRYELNLKYESDWVNEKTSKGVPYDWSMFNDVNLRGLTGNFYAGFYVKITKKRVVISSRDGKTNKLIKRYGDEIFGLTDKHIQIILQDVKKEILKDVRKQINNI